MITAKWQGIDAREEIYSFVEHLNDGLEHHNNFDKDFIMKSCLVLADLLVAYRVENFNNKNLDVIRANWSRRRRRSRSACGLSISWAWIARRLRAPTL